MPKAPPSCRVKLIVPLADGISFAGIPLNPAAISGGKVAECAARPIITMIANVQKAVFASTFPSA